MDINQWVCRLIGRNCYESFDCDEFVSISIESREAEGMLTNVEYHSEDFFCFQFLGWLHTIIWFIVLHIRATYNYVWNNSRQTKFTLRLQHHLTNTCQTASFNRRSSAKLTFQKSKTENTKITHDHKHENAQYTCTAHTHNNNRLSLVR